MDLELRQALAREVGRYCPSWLRANEDDIVQSAWLRLDEARRRSERNREPGASLIARVAYCATVDEIRRRRRRREVPVETIHASALAAAPEDRVRSREIGAAIRDCLSTMVPNRCLAATLYLQGHTAPETAGLLGFTLRKSENLIFRGLTDLRRCLSAKGIEP